MSAEELAAESSLSRRPTRKRLAIIFVAVICFIVAITMAVGLLLPSVGKRNLLHHESHDIESLRVYAGAASSDGGRTVVYNGRTYRLNEKVIPICVMGRDKELQAPGEGFNGQADAIMVIVVNTENSDINVVSIPRDSMVASLPGFRQVFKDSSYDIDKMQICLAYSYGENDEQSSEYTIAAVSDLLFGIPIEYYCTLDASGLGRLADLSDGVTLEALYDIPPTDGSSDMPIEAGKTVTLRGKDALRYVMYRDESRFASALERLERQRQFVAALGKKMAEKLRGDPRMILGISNLLRECSTTNLGIAELSYLASVAAEANLDNVDTTRLLGETVKNADSAWEQYLVDESSTYQTVLDAFYTRAD